MDQDRSGSLAVSFDRPVRVEAAVREARATRAPVPAPERGTGEPRVLLFGGSRRSGTTWLTAMLNSHPEIHLRNEGWLFNDLGDGEGGGCSFEDWIDPARFGAWAARREARGTWLRHLSRAEALTVMQRAMLRALMKEATLREGWKRWETLRYVGDKTTAHYFRKPEVVHRILPPGEAVFLNMIRDGRDVVVSDAFLTFRDGEFERFTAATRAHIERATAFHVRGEGTGEPAPLFNEELLTHLITAWVRSVAGGEQMRELYGASYLEVRYEDLVADTPGVVAGLYRLLGVNDDAALVAGIVHDCRFEANSGGRPRGLADNGAEFRRGVIGDWRGYFTEADTRLFKRIAGAALVELGYEGDLEW